MTEPLAIVGVACRMPGGINDLDALWAALKSGQDLVTEVPADRFDAARYADQNPHRPGKSYTFAGGFCADLAGFDADFFGIVPREASRIDPQQRMALEMTVEAFDDAGIDPATLAGHDVGVFVGLSNLEYWQMQHGEPSSINAYTNAGGAIGNAANRISYMFDLRGPSMAIDTACSSSLVAFHQACEYLRAGPGRMALAAGVNVLLNPYSYVGFAKASMLSPTGRCHTFSDNPDGFVRAEGGGLTVLKRLSEAVAAGDRVHAVVLGTGTNNDGRTMGLAVPNQQAQEDLLREVYSRHEIDPDELVYYEAHGTGTAVGDPIECAAIGNALGMRRASPLPVGSVKTNVGHLEPAAGMAGIMKALLVLRHNEIPASLHGTPHNPAIDFDGLRLAPVDEHQLVRPTTRSAVGVSAYGFGGSNAHALLAAPSTQSPASPEQPWDLPIVVSARSEAALTEAVERMADRLADPQNLYDLCYSASRRRGRHTHRVAALAAEPHQAVAALREATATTAVHDGRIVFAFSGNGSQYAEMGVDLLETEPRFAAAVEEIDAELTPLMGWSVIDGIRAPAERSLLSATEVAQPCLFAVQLGLVKLLEHYGVRPSVVYGHSFGEIPAAHVSGALTLPQAARLVWARSTAQAATAGAGKMAALGLSREDAEVALERFAGRLEIAGVNSGSDVTVSGELAALEELGAELVGRGVFFRILPIDYAFHSFMVDYTESMLRERLGDLRPMATRIPFISTLTGEPMGGEQLDTDYWWRNLRRAVLFAPATEHLVNAGFDTFVEVGPHPVLRYYLNKLVPAAGVVVPTVRRDCDGPTAVRAAVASLAAADARIDWERYFPRPGRVVELPAYPWQRERHWSGGPRSWERGNATAGSDHPLLGDRADVLSPTWQGPLELGRAPWIADHYVHGAVVMPGAAYVETALAAGMRALGGPVEVHTMRIPKALVLSEDPADVVTTQVSVSTDDGLVHIATRVGEAPEWRTHARARVRRLAGERPSVVNVAELPGRMTGRDLYTSLIAMGVTYRASFEVITELRIGSDEVHAGYSTDLPLDAYGAHPVIIDGAFQCAMALEHAQRLGHPFLPARIDSARLWQSPGPSGFVALRMRSMTERELYFDVSITDPDGMVAVEINGCRARRFDGPSGRPITRLVTELRAAPHLDLPVGQSDLKLEPGLEMPGATAINDFAPKLVARFTMAALPTADVLPKYHRLAQVLQVIAREHGPGSSDGDFAQAIAEHPDYVTELSLIGHAGRNLADILSGRRDPVELFFGEQSVESVRIMYDLAPLVRQHNQAARDLLRKLVVAWPADRPLRILEIGAGTGGMTAWLLPELPPERTRYVFTDVSGEFLIKARARFAEHDFVDYRPLDIDADPVAQGFGDGGFDLVIAANSLHATPDLRRSLRHVANLLDDGGHLLLMESHDLAALILPWGLFDGYWAFTDHDLRTDSPLLPVERWRSLLIECGFTTVVGVGPLDSNSLTFARRSAAPVPPAPQQPPDDLRRLVIAEDERELPLAQSLGGVALVGIPEQWREQVVIVLSEPPDGPHEACEVTVRRFALLQAAASALETAEIWLVTRPSGVQPGPEEPTVITDAALWGAMRCVAAEYPKVTVRRISLARGEQDADRILRELASPSDEDEIVLTKAGRFVPRLRPMCTTQKPFDGYALRLHDQGRAYRLDWMASDVPHPGPGQVVVAVRAAGVNNKDVLLASGIMTEEHVETGLIGGALGVEFAGVITAIGPDVSGLRPGDRVFGYGPGSFASHVVASVDRIGRMPDTMNFAEAATLPVGFLVAGYVAPLHKRQILLVHGAAGASGLAPIQYARRVGATVIATAGTPQKRDFLSLLGVDHVLDSRDLGYADQVRRLTAGRGVDVLLNSVPGESIGRGLELLAPGGRFIELGKMDLYADNSVSLRPFRNNVSYLGFDLDQLARDFPEASADRFAELVARVHIGEYRALPYRAYPAGRIADAFEAMAHSRHTGKIVVTFDEAPQVASVLAAPTLDPEGTYLVAGGLSGFGAEIARWLADRGARHVALVSRKGPDAAEAEPILADLASRGVTATAYAADIADADTLRKVLGGFAKPLRGLVHAAAVIDDAPLTELTSDRIRDVLRPKLVGAGVLDQLTRGLPLDLFLMVGSETGVFGYDGQANYAAGNLYLEALVRRRRKAGLPATVVAFGRIGEVGWVARHEVVAQALERRGSFAITPAEVFALLDEVVGSNIPVAYVGRHDWELAAPYLTRGAPRCEALAQTGAQPGRGAGLLSDLAQMHERERPAIVEEAMTRLIAGILNLDPDRLDRHLALDKLGVDSLISTEISDVIRREFHVEMPVMRVIGSGGIADLAHAVLTGLSF